MMSKFITEPNMNAWYDKLVGWDPYNMRCRYANTMQTRYPWILFKTLSSNHPLTKIHTSSTRNYRQVIMKSTLLATSSTNAPVHTIKGRNIHASTYSCWKNILEIQFLSSCRPSGLLNFVWRAFTEIQFPTLYKKKSFPSSLFFFHSFFIGNVQ
jgi:hypothetical protein